MKKNKSTLIILFTSLSIFLFSVSANAQMVGADAYMKGNYVEIGIDGAGGFEGVNITASPVPAGMHFRSSNPLFGFVANPQLNAWTTFDGDFFTPGTPENGWGFEIGTDEGDNNCVGVSQIPGTITSWSYASGQTLCDWEGDTTSATNLDFKINYQLQDNDLFYITTVTVTNNTGSTIPDFYYYRNVDSDNNVEISFDYTTQNTIISQPACCTYANVSSTSSVPASQPMSYFAFLTDADTNWRASYGGFSNRDASDLWNGVGFVQTVGATNFADEAISIAYKIQNLAPGDSASFKFCTVFDNNEVDCAIAAMAVSQTPLPNVMVATPPFTLTSGSPAGGTYSGTGVTGGNAFDPSVSGAGDFIISYTYTDTNACVSVANTTIHVGMVTGISTEIANSAITIFPNPFSETTTIKIGKDVKLVNAEMHIYDMLGKEVKLINAISNHEIKIDSKGLSEGMYMYMFINDGKAIASGKLFIK